MAKKKRKRRVAKKKVRRIQRARRGLASVSLESLQTELARRLELLQSRHDELAEELEAIEAEMTTYGEAAAPARKKMKKKRVGRPAKKKARKKVRRVKKKRVGRPAKKKARKKVTRRPRNKASLVESLRKVLTGRTLGVTEMAAAVKKGGYRTSSQNFRTIVNQTLIKNKKLFKRVARGEYTAA